MSHDPRGRSSQHLECCTSIFLVRHPGTYLSLLLLLLSQVAFAGDTDADGVGNRDDKCPEEPETVNGYADSDGCPDELGTLTVILRDLDGEVVRGKVTIGTERMNTDEDGTAVFEGLMPDTEIVVTATASTYETLSLDPSPVIMGHDETRVTLDWSPVPIRVVIRNEETGLPIDANLRFDGPGYVEPIGVGDDGEEVVGLRPGRWRVQAYRDNFTSAVLRIELVADQAMQTLEIGLSPTWAAFDSAKIFYAAGKSEIPSAMIPVVDHVVRDLTEFSDVDVEVRATWSDDDPDLSRDRARAVVGWLAEHGVASDRLTFQGMGSSKPAASPYTAEGQVANRRVELRVARRTTPDSAALASLRAARDAIQPHPIPFAAQSADLSEAATKVLQRALEALRSDPELTAEVRGHEDLSDGHPAALRAQRVVDYLVEAGVERTRLAPRIYSKVTSASSVSFAVLGGWEDVELPWTLHFDEGQTSLAPVSEGFFDELVYALLVHDHARVLVLGHADSAESEPLELSRRRAAAVVERLVARGVEAARLQQLGHGASYAVGAPVENRRVGLLVVPEPIPDYRIPFVGDSSDPADNSVLERIGTLLLEHPEVHLTVHGHATAGQAAEELAQARADEVRRRLGGLGVEATRLETKGQVESAGVSDGWVDFSVLFVELEREVEFPARRAELEVQAQRQLDQIAVTLLLCPSVHVHVRGFAGPDDGWGLEPLAESRARSAVDYLKRKGISADRLSADGKASKDAGSQQRVAFKVTRL